MSNRLSVLMTAYNEAEFIEYAIRACLPYVDDLVIVEGAYQQTIRCGAEPCSTDGTELKIIQASSAMAKKTVEVNGEEIPLIDNVHVYLGVNEETDKDQRNVGLKKIKELNPDGWLLIVDADEVYTKENFDMVRNFMKTMERQNKYAAYFKSLTFVNDFNHYVDQEFPRLFRITPECEFVNDNYMQWKDKGVGWSLPYVIKLPYLKYHHYGFCKGEKRLKLKSDWWNTRFGENSSYPGYDWYVNEEGKIWSPNHRVMEYTGRHPEIMKNHPMYPREENNEGTA